MTTTASAHKSPTSMTTTTSAHKSDQYSKKRPRTNSTSAASVESQQEDEKPLEIIMKRKEEPKKASSNGNHSFSPLNEQALVVKYKECRKNYAAHIGGYVLDGCREFMPSGKEGTDAGFTCAACSCHRNFHRREIEHDWCCDCSSASASPE